MSRFKCYGVSKGRGVGIFGTWKECQEMVKDFPGARFRGFYSRADAESWLSREGESVQRGRRCPEIALGVGGGKLVSGDVAGQGQT